MQFIITAYDGKGEDALDRRMAARGEHLANIEKLCAEQHVISAGGLTNEEGKPMGSYLVMEFASREEFDAYLAAEPYVQQKVWADIKVETCNVVIQNNQRVGK